MKDQCIRAIDKDKMIRASFAIGTNLVETARITHNTSPTASAALGRALLGGILLRTKLKDEKESLTLNISGGGPGGRIVVTGKNNGYVKGYVENPQVDLPVRSDNKLDVGGFVGNDGTIQLVMDLGLKENYVGNVALQTGEIAEDIAYYLFQSEQIPSGVALGVLVDTDTTIRVAGGYIIELLPGASEEIVTKLENNLSPIHSITDLIQESETMEELIEKVLPDFDMEILEEEEIAFVCECSKEKVKDVLISLPEKDIQEMIDEDHGAEVICHFCNQTYQLSEEELQELIEKNAGEDTKIL